MKKRHLIALLMALGIVFTGCNSNTVEEINNVFKSNANETLGYTFEELVSTDIIGISYGSLFDATLTKVLNNNLVKIAAWYDNEAGYTYQLIRTLKYIGENL